jgi:hypothetical protein
VRPSQLEPGLRWPYRSATDDVADVVPSPQRKDVLRLDDSSGDSEPNMAQTELSTGRYSSASQLDMACGRR